ncbi:hypothetical protein [Streptomyces sp. NPDC005336]|uniref:hypothetical protein n=1 Tax=Streptomyces sp. NPDC005336 TaxID=3157035 RepID=UPI0033ACE0CA
MATVYRKGEPEKRDVQVFELNVDEKDREAMRADPEKFIRKALEPELPTINRVSIDTKVLSDLESGNPGVRSHTPYVAHHVESGQWASDVTVTNQM